MGTITIELFANAEERNLRQIHQLIIDIRGRKPSATILGLIAALIIMIGVVYLDMQGIPLGVSFSSSKNLLWLLLTTTGLAFSLAVLLFYLVFKPRNRLDTLKLKDVLSQNETREALLKLRGIRGLLEALPRQSDKVDWLSSSLLANADTFLAWSLAKG